MLTLSCSHTIKRMFTLLLWRRVHGVIPLNGYNRDHVIGGGGGMCQTKYNVPFIFLTGLKIKCTQSTQHTSLNITKNKRDEILVEVVLPSNWPKIQVD